MSARQVGFDVEEAQSVLARLSASWRRRPRLVKPILDNVSFTLNQGDWVALYGGAGAGKTTLLRLLTGVIKPSRGHVTVNGKAAHEHTGLAAGYVSPEEHEDIPENVGKILRTFGATHGIGNLPSRIGAVTEALSLRHLMTRRADTLSATERIKVNLARAALSDAPLILLDDCNGLLGATALSAILFQLFQRRTVIIATRSAAFAEDLNLPVLLLHQGTLACSGTCNEIADRLSAPRVMDVWVEGMRYDMFRTIKKHPGVAQVLLLPDGRFHGQRLRVTLKSSHHLPALYDLVSRVPLIRIEELPVNLEDILSRL